MYKRVLMLINFDGTGERAFWGDTPQGCWNEFLEWCGEDLEEYGDVEELAAAAEFFTLGVRLDVRLEVEKKVTFHHD